MPKQAKVELVSELRDDIQRSTALLMADYRGLKVSEISTLRRILRESGVELKVVKNTLFERAAKESGEIALEQLLEGPTAVAFVHDDPIGPAKALVDFARDHKIMTIKGGYVEGRVCTGEQIQSLSRIPPRQVLLAQMVGSLQSPLSGLVGTLQGVLSGLVYTLQAVADQKAA